MLVTSNRFEIHESDAEECKSGVWKNEQDTGWGMADGEDLHWFQSGRERERQEFRALNERMLRGAGRHEAREGR
jgi:hypothetical protein